MRRRLRRWRGRNWTVGGFAYEDAIAFLVGRGVDEDVLRLASIDAVSLRYAAAMIERHARPGALRVLHIGNFAGVSLAALSALVGARDPGSTVVSIDPNDEHLGVGDLESHVVALLERYGLSARNEILRGYTLAPTGGGGLLADLERRGERFDVALIDGNHDPDYVRGELEMLARLVDAGGLLLLDDVSPHYKGVRRLFREVAASADWPFEAIGHDSRIGVLRRSITR